MRKWELHREMYYTENYTEKDFVGWHRRKERGVEKNKWAKKED